MAKRIPVIDTDECIACGNCEQVCPEVFRLNEALGHSEVINPGGAPGKRRSRMPWISARCSVFTGRMNEAGEAAEMWPQSFPGLMPFVGNYGRNRKAEKLTGVE